MTDDEPIMIGGRYELGDLLGRGGMAEVRRAHDTRLNRPVAIKQLRVDLAGDPTFQARFRKEAQSAAGLNHPNIVAVYDTGEEPDPRTGVSVPYIVMELVEGKTLRAVLRDGRKIMPERALELTAGVLEALSYSHRAGIVHRDIKPANVMLTPSGAVKVMDFGIARAVADTSATMTATAAVIGTAQYLSPEQARGETVDARSDLYSAGCLLYELLTGRPPFVGESPVSVAYQHVREEPVPPSHLDAMITPEMDRIVLKALAKRPEDRYQSAREMKNDITRLLAGEQPTAVLSTSEPTPAPTVVVPTAVPSAVATVPEPGDDTLFHGSDDEVERRRRGPLIALITLIIVAVLAVGAIGVFVLNPFGSSPSQTPSASEQATVEVPETVGYQQVDAENRLRLAGLTPKIKQVRGKDDGTVGQVTASNPPAGTEVAPGATVELEVNVGPETGTIPVNLVGKSVDEVVKELKAAGFTKIDTQASSDEPVDAKKNQVLQVSPEPGTPDIPLAQRITVVYATGQVRLPDWTGKTKAEVEADASQLPVTIKWDEEDSATATPGTVVRQDPGPGDVVDKNSTVTVYLARTPAESSTPPPSTPESTGPSGPSSSPS